MNRANLRFCRRRDEKAEIARELGLTHFVDDRPDVLAAMVGVVRFRFLFGPQRGAPPQHTHVPDWQSAAAAIRASLTASGASGSAAAPTR